MVQPGNADKAVAKVKICFMHCRLLDHLHALFPWDERDLSNNMSVPCRGLLCASTMQTC